MKLRLLTLLVLLAAFTSSAQSDDFSNNRDHLFPSQVMFEVSLPFGSAKSNAVELSFNFNNFDNLSTRNLVATFDKQGNLEIPTFNSFGEGAAAWASANPMLAIGAVVVVGYGISVAIDDDDDGLTCPDVWQGSNGNCLVP